MDKKALKLIVFVLVLFAIGMVLASLSWQGDTIYSGAYAPMVEKSLKRKQAEQLDSPKSEQPDAMGLKEREINRQKGDRFSTY